VRPEAGWEHHGPLGYGELQEVFEETPSVRKKTEKESTTEPICLTKKEWRAIKAWFRAEEAVLRDSYGEPRNREGTYRKHYAKASPTGSALYEAAREVFGDES